MNRRSFIKGVFSAIAVLTIPEIPKVLLPKEVAVVKYAGYHTFDAGYIYAPYIPLQKTVLIVKEYL